MKKMAVVALIALVSLTGCGSNVAETPSVDAVSENQEVETSVSEESVESVSEEEVTEEISGNFTIDTSDPNLTEAQLNNYALADNIAVIFASYQVGEELTWEKFDAIHDMTENPDNYSMVESIEGNTYHISSGCDIVVAEDGGSFVLNVEDEEFTETDANDIALSDEIAYIADSDWEGESLTWHQFNRIYDMTENPDSYSILESVEGNVYTIIDGTVITVSEDGGSFVVDFND